MPDGTDGAGIGNRQRRRTRRRGNSSSLELIARWTEVGAIPMHRTARRARDRRTGRGKQHWIYPVAKRNRESC